MWYHEEFKRVQPKHSYQSSKIETYDLLEHLLILLIKIENLHLKSLMKSMEADLKRSRTSQKNMEKDLEAARKSENELRTQNLELESKIQYPQQIIEKKEGEQEERRNMKLIVVDLRDKEVRNYWPDYEPARLRQTWKTCTMARFPIWKVRTSVTY